MTAPVRLQLSRAKGFSLQAHSRAVNGLEAVNCTRPGRWGNVWKIGDRDGHRTVKTKWDAVSLFRRQCEAALTSEIEGVSERTRAALDEELRGKNLACWCKLDEPWCHVDVLLEFANHPEKKR